MLDTLYIDAVEQADALLKPKRVEVLRQLAEPRTCTQIGQVLGETPQAIYYHVKRLQAAGLVKLVEEHRVRGIVEGVYQAVAKSFWVAPKVVGRLGPERERDALLGLGFLLDLTEEMQHDLAELAAGPPSLPSFGIAGDIRLAPEDGAAFVAELQQAFGEVLTRYSGGEGHSFRLALACYPHRQLPAAQPPLPPT
jgi:DNA-binding transcriptional ArsR family regulator